MSVLKMATWERLNNVHSMLALRGDHFYFLPMYCLSFTVHFNLLTSSFHAESTGWFLFNAICSPYYKLCVISLQLGMNAAMGLIASIGDI